MDFQALLHNKWALGGVGVAAAAGAFVLYRRKSAGGSSGGSTAQASPAYSSGGAVGSFDSTGTDVAAWLGQEGGMLQTQLDAYQKQLTDTLSGVSAIPPAGADLHPSGDQLTTMHVIKGQNVDDWINTYGSGVYGLLTNLNPTIPGVSSGLAGNTDFRPDDHGGMGNSVFLSDATYVVPTRKG